MQRILLGVVFLLSVLATPARAMQYVIEVDAGSLLRGGFGFELESEFPYARASSTSFAFGRVSASTNYGSLSGTEIGSGLRYYPGGEVLSGFWFGGRLSTTFFSGRIMGDSVAGSATGFLGELGHKWRTAGDFVVDLRGAFGAASGYLSSAWVYVPLNLRVATVGLGLGLSF